MPINYSQDTLEKRLENTINDLIKQVREMRTDQITWQGYFSLPRKATDPTGAPDGSIYYNTTSNKMKIKENGAWKTVTSS